MMSSMRANFIIGIPIEIQITLNKYIEEILQQPRKQVKIITIISKESYVDIFKNSLDNFDVVDWDYKELYRENNFTFSRFDIKRTLYKHIINGNFLVVQKGKVAYIITGESGKFITSGINFITKRLFPKVIIAYLTSSEIYNLLQYFGRHIEKKLYYKNEVKKRMFGKRQTDVGYMIGKSKKRLSLFEEAFKKAHRDNLWIDKITIFSEDYEYYFDLSRDGVLKIKMGTFGEYYPLLLKIGEIYLDRMKFYENRGRMNQPHLEINPIKLPLEDKLFMEEDIREQFIEVIKNYTNCQYSIVYSGNPHIHVNIIDKIDNSMFSIKTYYSDSLIISPQVKTSEASLIRFTKHLLENFRESNAQNFRSESS